VGDDLKIIGRERGLDVAAGRDVGHPEVDLPSSEPEGSTSMTSVWSVRHAWCRRQVLSLLRRGSDASPGQCSSSAWSCTWSR